MSNPPRGGQKGDELSKKRKLNEITGAGAPVGNPQGSQQDKSKRRRVEE
jgi:hypothetical protein